MWMLSSLFNWDKVKNIEAFHSPSPKYPQLLSMSYNKMIQNSQSIILEKNLKNQDFLNKCWFKENHN